MGRPVPAPDHAKLQSLLPGLKGRWAPGRKEHCSMLPKGLQDQGPEFTINTPRLTEVPAELREALRVVQRGSRVRNRMRNEMGCDRQPAWN